ncbi:MAG: alanine racemase [Clostridia bacterium]|nr:alanine racemase [Clostridia bacterium]
MLRKNRVLIDLDALRNNYCLVKKRLPDDVKVMCVVKADGYGHGILETARALSQAGAGQFAVAIAEEGVQLREHAIPGEILVLGAATPRAAAEAIRYDLSQTVFTPDMVYLLENEAVKQGKQALVHIKLDTGMNRIGLRTVEEAASVAKALSECPHVTPAGIYTHLAAADEPNPDGTLNDYSVMQLERFAKLRACFDPSIPAHAANSALTLLGQDGGLDMVRAGIVLYGYPPVKADGGFKAVMSWQTEVVHVKTVQAGESIGYGCAFTADREMRIATVAVGYGDGYQRACSNGGMMLIHGRRAPIVGRVCMDQTMLDVTDIPGVVPGDEAVILGSQGQEVIDAEEIAGWANTISYEILLSIAPRVPRLFAGR